MRPQIFDKCLKRAATTTCLLGLSALCFSLGSKAQSDLQNFIRIPDPSDRAPAQTMPSMSALNQAQCTLSGPEDDKAFLARFATQEGFRSQRVNLPLRLVTRSKLNNANVTSGLGKQGTVLPDAQNPPGLELLDSTRLIAREREIFGPLVSNNTSKKTTFFNQGGFDVEVYGRVSDNGYSIAVYRFVKKGNCWTLASVERG